MAKARRKFIVTLTLTELEYNYIESALWHRTREHEMEVAWHIQRNGHCNGTNYESLMKTCQKTLRNIRRQREQQHRAFVGEKAWKENRAFVAKMMRKARRKATQDTQSEQGKEQR
jgi:hypothetical protein